MQTTTTTREFFTNGQLNLIASAAVVCAEPFDGEKTMSDEMAVYDMIANYAQGFTSEQLVVLEFCAQECERQKSGPESVYRMVNAWLMGTLDAPQLQTELARLSNT